MTRRSKTQHSLFAALSAGAWLADQLHTDTHIHPTELLPYFGFGSRCAE